jgi:hypothetical protein
MTEAASSGNTPFDLEKLQQLVEMMEKHGLSEVTNNGDCGEVPAKSCTLRLSRQCPS